MSNRSRGRLQKEDRRGGVPDIGHELMLTPEEFTATGKTSPETESTWGNRAPARNWNPFVAIVLGLLIAAVIGVAGIGIWLAVSPDVPPPEDKPGVWAGRGSPAAELRAEQLNAAIESVARGYLEANNELARSRFVVGGRDALAAMREYHSRPGVGTPQSFGRILDRSPTVIDGLPMHMVMVAEKEGNTTHLLSILPIRDRMLIDWESSVGFGELSWEKFISTKPIHPVQMRIYLKHDTAFNHAFSDDSIWDSYEVSTRGYPDTLPAFVAKNSDPGRQIRKLVQPGASQPLNIRLHWADEGRALLITELIHNYWIDVDRLRSLSNR